jgi:hypothetical protein
MFNIESGIVEAKVVIPPIANANNSPLVTTPITKPVMMISFPDTRRVAEKIFAPRASLWITAYTRLVMH